MGWDCFYRGKLEDITLQEKVIEFLSDYSDHTFLVFPDRNKKYKTKIYGTYSEVKDDRIFHERPFNYYGVVSHGFHWQFVFDLNSGGQIVSFENIPKEHYPSGKDHSLRDDEDWGREYEVLLSQGGSVRRQTFMAFALSVVKLRWWPDLFCCDDSGAGKAYLSSFWSYGITGKLMDERYDLHECYEIWEKEHHKYYPPKKKIEVEPVEQPKPKLVLTNPSDLEIGLNDLNLSVRTQMVIDRIGIKTIGELVCYSKEELLSMCNFAGKKTMKKTMVELDSELRGFGLFLRDK